MKYCKSSWRSKGYFDSKLFLLLEQHNNSKSVLWTAVYRNKFEQFITEKKFKTTQFRTCCKVQKIRAGVPNVLIFLGFSYWIKKVDHTVEHVKSSLEFIYSSQKEWVVGGRYSSEEHSRGEYSRGGLKSHCFGTRTFSCIFVYNSF